MARKAKLPEHENHERWLVSYADFITLLFAFFVVMFATSQTDKGAAKRVQDSVKKALAKDEAVSAIAAMLGGTRADVGKGNAQLRGPGGQKTLTESERNMERFPELVPTMKMLEIQLAEQIARHEMQIKMEARGLVISFQQAAFFPSGTDKIPATSLPAVSKVAQEIRKLPNPVRLEGHTDSVPVGTKGPFASNWVLSAARSIAMMDMIVSCCDVGRERLSIAGYADNAPVADNSIETGRMQNRRVDIVILNRDGSVGEPARAANASR